jgi:predicted dehydrogenase
MKNDTTPLRSAVIGIRGMGRVHAEDLARHPRAALQAVADLDEESARQLAQEHQARAYADYRAMLERESLDAVVIATPHHLHAPMGLEALEAGLHVLVEKPIAVRVSEADRMVELAGRKSRVLAVGHNYRTFPGNLKLKELVDTLGPLYRVLWQWLENRPEAYYRRDLWRCTWKHAGGGVLMNQASHDLDLLCWLLGDPVEVSAMVGNLAHQHEVEDTALASVRFAGGAYASVQLSTCGPCLNCRQFCGEQGIVYFQDERNANVHTPQVFRLGRYREPLRQTLQTHAQPAGQPEVVWEEVDCGSAASPTLLDSFVDACLEGTQPIAEGASARRSLELINAILLSGVRRKVVCLPVDREEYDALLEELSSGKTRLGR